MLTKDEFLKECASSVDEFSARQVHLHMQNLPGTLLLDVREKHEFDAGHLPNATHLSRGFLEMKIEKLCADRSQPIICYCGGGNRSLLAAETLQRMGYKQVVSMRGGIRGWKEQGLEVESPESLSTSQQLRYQRHLAIPEVGELGQQKLLQSKVLVIGAGGLGSPAAYYLAAAGVGELGVVDFDRVDESNLQRQILHTTERVGMPKTESAKRTLLALNPHIQVKAIEARINPENVEDILKGHDVVVDGCDNFPTRYLINDACVKLGIPNVHGSVFRFEGQVSLFHAPDGPCYRCLYPEAPPAEQAPSCAEAGVLGAVPGVIGILQAIEVIKLLLGQGESLLGRLLRFDALKGELSELRLAPEPGCNCQQGLKAIGEKAAVASTSA